MDFNYENFAEDRIHSIALECIRHKKIKESWDCLKYFSSRQMGSVETISQFIDILLRFIPLISGDEGNLDKDKLTNCRDWLLKFQRIEPPLFPSVTIENINFFVGLAECHFWIGPRSDAIKLYSEITSFSGRSTDYYRLAELLFWDSRDVAQVKLIMQMGIQKDPGKYWIRTDLERKLLDKSHLSLADIRTIADSGFKFSNSWFSGVIPVWNKLLPNLRPERILEIGSYEGASTTHLIELLSRNSDVLEIHCIDTWEGGEEHKKQDIDFKKIENLFDNNIAIASRNKSNLKIEKHKGFSDVVLAKLLTEGKKNYFDFIYIDGSHQASDVLCDAVLGFRLLKIGGILAFDDYMFMDGAPSERNIFNCPKPAIDSFINIYFRKIKFMAEVGSNYQVYIEKYSD